MPRVTADESAQVGYGQSLPKRNVCVACVCPSISDMMLQRRERRFGAKNRSRSLFNGLSGQLDKQHIASFRSSGLKKSVKVDLHICLC